MKKRIVTIWRPDGSQVIYTTSKEVNEGDPSWELVDTIECEENRVNIAFKQDGKVEGKAYVGMPYLLEMF